MKDDKRWRCVKLQYRLHKRSSLVPASLALVSQSSLLVLDLDPRWSIQVDFLDVIALTSRISLSHLAFGTCWSNILMLSPLLLVPLILLTILDPKLHVF